MLRRRSVIGFGAAIVLSFAGYSFAQQPVGEKSNANSRENTTTTVTNESHSAKAEETAKPEKPKLKIFELKQIKPSELAQLLSYDRAHLGATATAAAAHTHEGVTAVDVSRVAVVPTNLNLAFDDEKNLLLVRGSSSQVRRIEKLVKALDAEKGKLQEQSIDDLHILPLQHSDANQVQSLLSQLGMDAHAVQLGKAGAIVIREQDEDEVKQIQEVISKLDTAKGNGSEQRTAETTTAGERERR